MGRVVLAVILAAGVIAVTSGVIIMSRTGANSMAGSPESTSLSVSRPPIDVAAPVKTETATFALG